MKIRKNFAVAEIFPRNVGYFIGHCKKNGRLRALFRGLQLNNLN